MGKLAFKELGYEKFSEVGIIISGITNPDTERGILKLFEGEIARKDSVYKFYLLRKNKENYAVAMNVYGSTALNDVIKIMKDGGCSNIIFIGNALNGFKNLKAGEVVLPYKSNSFEGADNSFKLSDEEAFADAELMDRLEKMFKVNMINYAHGVNVSVPSNKFQLKYENLEHRKINPATMETELTNCLSNAKERGIRAAGILFISEGKSRQTSDKEIKNEAKLRVIKTVIQNFDRFKLSFVRAEKADVPLDPIAYLDEQVAEKKQIKKEEKKQMPKIELIGVPEAKEKSKFKKAAQFKPKLGAGVEAY